MSSIGVIPTVTQVRKKRRGRLRSGFLCQEKLHLGVQDADGRHAVGLIDELNILEDVRACLLQDAKYLNRQQPDFCVGMRTAAHLEEMPPGTGIAGDKDFRIAGIGKY